jgi:hypothetical protein
VAGLWVSPSNGFPGSVVECSMNDFVANEVVPREGRRPLETTGLRSRRFPVEPLASASDRTRSSLRRVRINRPFMPKPCTCHCCLYD